MTRKKNPLVFLDVSVDGDPAERMVFELFTDVVPKTSENFRALCTGEKGIGPKTGKPLHYKGSFFHHIINGVMAQAGDFVKRDGTGGESIYGEKFPDEPFKLKHDDRGILSMPIADRDSHGSHFIVTFKPNHQLDRKSVVFGKLVDGSGVLAKMENVGNEDGTPSVTVKIINSGEYNEGKKKLSRGKHKKYHRERRKRRRKYYTSDSDSSSETDTESSDSDSDSSDSSSSYISSSSDERRRKRKRSSKRDKYRRGKRRDKRREKKHRKRDKRSKRLSKRASDSFTDAESKSESESSFKAHDTDVQGANPRGRNDLVAARRQSPSVGEKEVPSVYYRTGKSVDMPVKEDGVFPKENGGRRSNGIEAGNGNKSDNSADRQPDVVDDDPDKSRSHSRSMSPKRTMSKSMSISPRRSPSRSPSVSSKRSISRSPTVSPLQRSHRSRSLSRSVSGSPVRGKNERSISPLRGSPVRSLPRRSPSRSLPRTSSRRSVSRSSVRVGRMSVSRSPVRSSRRSLSRSSGRPRKSISGSPIRARSRNVRRSYSRSASPVRRVRSPDHERSPDRSVSPDDSSKRIRRGRGFSQRYSYARRYRTRSPDRSPARGYRYGGRGDRDRYSSYRRYSPRRNRSPPRGRTPPRYRGRRSRTRSQSASRSPVRHRSRNYSRSPVRRHSPVEVSRYHVSSRSERRRSPSRSRSPYRSRSSLDSESPRRASKDRSRSSSGSPVGKKGLVSYGDGSPDSGQR